MDATGRFVTDPRDAVALAPAGGADFGYKGAGLAGLAEVLGGVLTGMRLSAEQDGHADCGSRTRPFRHGHRPDPVHAARGFRARLQTYLDAFKPEPGTMAAGGPEWERRREREADGIPLPDGLYAELKEAAQAAGIEFGL